MLNKSFVANTGLFQPFQLSPQILNNIVSSQYVIFRYPPFIRHSNPVDAHLIRLMINRIFILYIHG
jgi:hypothetical protein